MKFRHMQRAAILLTARAIQDKLVPYSLLEDGAGRAGACEEMVGSLWANELFPGTQWRSAVPTRIGTTRLGPFGRPAAHHA